MSRKSVPKQKGGIPLDELLAEHLAGDDARLATLMDRGKSVVPASTVAAKRAQAAKRPKSVARKPVGARFVRSDDLEVVQIAPTRLMGYARVSTDAQTTRLQLDALKAVGCERIFEDKESGALRSRPKLDRALAELHAGDTLVVWKLDRLGRSLRHLHEISETLRERGVALRSLTEHIDTATAAGKMLYAVLGAVAQFERDVLRERTVAGMRAAKSRASTSAVRWRSNPHKCARRARCSRAAKAPRMSPACCAWVARRSTAPSDEYDLTDPVWVAQFRCSNLGCRKPIAAGRAQTCPKRLVSERCYG